MINHEDKLIFIHINKCGGSTIDTLLNRRHRGHNHVLYYKEKFPKKFDSYFKFSFVRNPWDKMVSFYHFHVRRGWDLNWDWDKSHAPSFQDFIKIIYNYSKSQQRAIFRRWTSTSCMRMSNHLDWLTDKDGKILVDFIGRVENFQSDFDEICDKIGIAKRKLIHKNKSKHRYYAEYYDDEARRIVAEKFARDIEYFGYKFGE